MQIDKRNTFLTGKVRLTLDPPQERVHFILDYSPVISRQDRIVNYSWNIGASVSSCCIDNKRIYLLLSDIPKEPTLFNFGFDLADGCESLDSVMMVSQSVIESDDWAKVTPIEGYLVNGKVLLRFVRWSISASKVDWLIHNRTMAKERKDWTQADSIRTHLSYHGVELHDDRGETWWNRK